jgi:hypothetical protein
MVPTRSSATSQARLGDPVNVRNAASAKTPTFVNDRSVLREKRSAFNFNDVERALCTCWERGLIKFIVMETTYFYFINRRTKHG